MRKPRVSLDAKLRLHPITLERQSGFLKARSQLFNQITKRFFQMLFKQVLVFNKPLAVLMKIKRLQERNSLVAKTFERSHQPSPTKVSQASSSITSMPSSDAFASFDPAPGPATTRSVFLETEPAVLAP